MKFILVVFSDISKQLLDGLPLEFGTHVHVLLGMNCNNFGDPLTFPSGPTDRDRRLLDDLTCTSLDCGRKPEHPGETHAGSGRIFLQPQKVDSV